MMIDFELVVELKDFSKVHHWTITRCVVSPNFSVRNLVRLANVLKGTE